MTNKFCGKQLELFVILDFEWTLIDEKEHSLSLAVSMTPTGLIDVRRGSRKGYFEAKLTTERIVK
jgi:hypothetical protein